MVRGSTSLKAGAVSKIQTDYHRVDPTVKRTQLKFELELYFLLSFQSSTQVRHCFRVLFGQSERVCLPTVDFVCVLNQYRPEAS